MVQIAICDDDPRDLRQLKTVIQSVMKKYSIHYNIVAYDSGEELMESPLTFHLIFLDVRMDKHDGIEIGKKIYRKSRTTKIIFQTHFGEYCGDAINKSHAFGFLEKPVTEAMIDEQIREFFEIHDGVQEIWMEFRHVRYLVQNEYLEREIVKIPIRDIIYFEYLQQERNIKVVTSRGNFSYSETLNSLEEKMKPFGFEVCSKGILVNMDKIKLIKGHNVLLCDGSSMPLSQRRNIYFKERLNEFVRDSFLKNNG